MSTYNPDYRPETWNMEYDEEAQAYRDTVSGNYYRDSQGYEPINDDD